MVETIRWPVPVILAALVVVIAGMKAASDLLEPFLLAIFISIVCVPAVNWLVVRRCPEALAVLLVMLGLLLVVLLSMAVLGASVNDFMGQLPVYQAALTSRAGGLLEHLAAFGIDTDTSAMKERFDPGVAIGLAGRLMGRFGSVLGNALLILVAVAFILLEAARMPAKVRAATKDASHGLAAFGRFAEGVKTYLAIKSMVSLGTGVLVALWVWILDVDYPLLWGALAFLFNYIPNIGSFLAAIPAVLLAWVLHGSLVAGIVAAGYVAINTIVGNFLEPRLMGRSLGLSTLVVFVSLIFWGWVLGPVGMVLSVPLTMILRIGLESHENTRWVAIMLGPEVEEPPPA
ncbi:MAG: AI-2E family transporter [Alcanivoracaceae bacterium]